MARKITYSQAYRELLEIVEEIENAEIDIDQLDPKIKRAAELLKICREKLYNTELSVTNVLEALDE